MIVFPEAQLAVLAAEAEKAYPHECCGLIIGWVDQDTTWVSEVVPSPNIASGDRRDSFEVDPQIRFDVMRRLRGESNEIVGHYHSHPDNVAEPSARDLSMAYEPDLVWVIVATRSEQVTDIRAHRLDTPEAGFVEIPLLSDPETS